MSDAPKPISIRIAIDVPVEVATETIAKLELMLARLGQLGQIEPEQTEGIGFATPIDEEAVQEERNRLKENRLKFKRLAIQSYRTYRRIENDFEKPNEAIKQIAEANDWPPSCAHKCITDRRSKIRHYLRFRRMKTAIAMARKGISETKIATHVGVGQSTVNRMLKEARAQKVGGLS